MIVYICSDQPSHASLAARLININMESSNNTTIRIPGFSVLAYCLWYKCKLQCLNILFRLASLSGKMKINQLLHCCSMQSPVRGDYLLCPFYCIFIYIKKQRQVSSVFQKTTSVSVHKDAVARELELQNVMSWKQAWVTGCIYSLDFHTNLSQHPDRPGVSV